MPACKRFALTVLMVLTGSAPLAAQDLVARDKKAVTIKKVSPDQLDFMVGTEVVTSYRFGTNFAKPIFWPVLAPNGASLTRTWPIKKDIPGESTDHVHQKSAWFCHGDVIPEGIELKDRIKGVDGVDFWSEAKGHGKIVCTKVGEPEVTGGHPQVATHNEWRLADGTKIMDEERALHFYDFGKARLVVLAIDLEASVCPITFGDTKEGSMGFRINDQIRGDKGKGKLQNAQGKVGEKDCWGYRSDWTDYSGQIDGKLAGLALLDDPANAYRACWHIRGYGLDAANPFGRNKSKFPDMLGQKELVKLAKGAHLKLRYGLVLHDGDAASGGVGDVFGQFVALRGKEK